MVNAAAKSGKCENGEDKLYIQTSGKQYAIENIILENKDVIGAVVRPSFTFGRSGGPLFKNLLFNNPD